MINPFPSLPRISGYRHCLAAAMILAATCIVLGQPTATPPPPPDISEIGEAPGFVPPPPPESISTPTFLRNNSPAANPTRRTVARPTRTAPPVTGEPLTIPTDEELLQTASRLVDESDPRMMDTVGLVRIPEMGTNEVLEMLENFTGKPILRQQTLAPVKITFFSQEELTRGEAIIAIESLLALNGIAITELGDKFLKAVPAAVINAQVGRPWEGSTLDAMPSQVIYEKLYELDFLTTAEAATFLQPLMSQGAPIAFDKSNMILVTDALVNLQRIERILPLLDKPARLRTKMLFFELQNIQAEEVVRRLQKLMTGVLRNQLENNTTFEADERTNQLVVFTHPTNEPILTELIERLDIDVAPTTATKVYSIRYADATEVVNIIDQIVTGQRQIRQEAQREGSATNTQAAQAAAAAARARQAQIQQSNRAAAAAREGATNLQFSDFLTIVPDERANTIVASGTNNDLAYLDQLVNEIDSLLAQVRIEVVITDVNLSDDDTRGIDSFDFNINGPGFFDWDLDGEDVNWTAVPGGDIYGLSFGPGAQRTAASGNTPASSSISFILSAARNNSDINVLSAPTIVTTHNKEATVSVGQERPVITSSTNYSTTGQTGLPVTQDQVQYRDIKIELKVTPLIGSDGVVQLEIEQQVQNLAGSVLVNDLDQPIIGTRTATSYVSVKDGELIVLGGLQSLSISDTESHMAILGDIPLLGNLFKRNSEELTRTELLIFIRPTIIRTTDEANADANQLIDVLEGSEDIRDYLDTGTFREAGKKK
ncbi:MAG: secretin N-terminal domain-containing protein [Puniceicoccaceae bacterium]